MSMEPLNTFNQNHHDVFMEQGYVRLGKVLLPDGLAELQQRIDDIMMGRVQYPHMRLQVFEENGKVRRTQGNDVATLAHRRIDDLEQDPLFLAYIQHPLFHQIARRYIGEEVSVFRSMFMNKPPAVSQPLVWHQDVGAGWGIDHNPLVTVWTALDDATTETGCMQIVPGSNRHGVINERHVLPSQDQDRYAPAEAVIDVEAEAGETILLHNFLLHRSGTNSTDGPRRAFSVTYMDAEVRTVDTRQTFSKVFGVGALNPATVGATPAELIERFYG